MVAVHHYVVTLALALALEFTCITDSKATKSR